MPNIGMVRYYLLSMWNYNHYVCQKLFKFHKYTRIAKRVRLGRSSLSLPPHEQNVSVRCLKVTPKFFLTVPLTPKELFSFKFTLLLT